MSVGFHPDPGRNARLVRLRADSPPPRVLLTRPAKPKAKPCPRAITVKPNADTVSVVVLPDADRWLKYGIPKPATQEIIDECCKAFGIRREEILSIRKLPSIVVARSTCAWLLRRHTSNSLPQIGLRLGGRDHTTILHSCRRIDALMAQYAIAPHENWRITLGHLSKFSHLPRKDMRPPRSASPSAERGG